MNTQKLIKKLGATLLAATSLSAFAAAYPSQFVRNVSEDGSEYILADSTGKTLYTFDPDPTDGTPVCNAANACEEKWPPVLLNDDEVASTVAPFGVVTRASGLKQLTLNGKALYTFFLDRNPGQNLGDGLGGVWHDIHQEVNVAGCKLTDFVDATSLTPTVGVSGFNYTPKCLRIKKGTKVTFTASGIHPLEAMNDALGFSNPLRALGEQTANFSHQFSQVGVFGYFCGHHGNISGGGMAGALEVVE